MLIFIENTPRAYAWGSREALPELLGTRPTGEPQAELWLGAHPGGPATVAKAAAAGLTLIELIESDPERYGVDGGQLPFLLKVLAIGAPLSLQVHPDLAQARAGFAAEEAAGIPRGARERNYGDPNHKPELLVALSEVSALSGFRPLAEARAELLALGGAVAGPDRDALRRAADRCSAARPEDEPEARRSFLAWALGGGAEALAAVRALGSAAGEHAAAAAADGVPERRLACLRELRATHPDDPGALVSLLLHLVHLRPGEAIYLEARQLHAYLAGVAVEVMAASDNVLRAGLTEKHVDVAELLRILDPDELAEPRMPARRAAPGLLAWEPGVADFRLLRARLCEPGEAEGGFPEPASDAAGPADAAALVEVDAAHPLVLIVTAGRVRVERPAAELDEVASVGRGQSLYVSAGEVIELSGRGEAFLATVGAPYEGA
ncbi:mannose-6-phosphate isomerase, class I [Leucobacter weissii]|uniref:mannose-6-phosphate isomerase n=1 Tax=Leucobacter weissii TaxID=1983706 RepID=A0A939MIG2_9MICO|nr:mannose-6-phosphate isomerase, class I [Leucobacter weissii]MBO1900615.1 mannose-6-phosphate isomerase, class I [Leucobacter weissii]